MMPGPMRLKLVGAALLLASLSLPQYTCALYRGPDGGVWSQLPPGADSSKYEPFTERHYALEELDALSLQTWLTILTFAWPVPLLAVRMRSRRPRLNRVLWWAEVFLIIGSGYLILVFSSLGARAAGAYVGFAGCLAYLGAWIAELRQSFRKAPA